MFGFAEVFSRWQCRTPKQPAVWARVSNQGRLCPETKPEIPSYKAPSDSGSARCSKGASMFSCTLQFLISLLGAPEARTRMQNCMDSSHGTFSRSGCGQGTSELDPFSFLPFHPFRLFRPCLCLCRLCLCLCSYRDLCLCRGPWPWRTLASSMCFSRMSALGGGLAGGPPQLERCPHPLEAGLCKLQPMLCEEAEKARTCRPTHDWKALSS